MLRNVSKILRYNIVADVTFVDLRSTYYADRSLAKSVVRIFAAYVELRSPLSYRRGASLHVIFSDELLRTPFVATARYRVRTAIDSIVAI